VGVEDNKTCIEKGSWKVILSTFHDRQSDCLPCYPNILRVATTTLNSTKHRWESCETLAIALLLPWTRNLDEHSSMQLTNGISLVRTQSHQQRDLPVQMRVECLP
jgi:hypothetical protein